ncbi:MAG: protein kinase [Planctomycetota bacterium]
MRTLVGNHGSDGDFAVDTFAAFVAERRPVGREDFAPLLDEHPQLRGPLTELIDDWLDGIAALHGSNPRPTAAAPSDRYEVGDEVARGAMGSIHLVRDQQLGRDLAMKVMLLPQQEDDARRRARFTEEACIAAQLDHPGVVPVHELGVDDAGSPFFTMKLVRGETLHAVFARREAGDPEWTLPRILGVLSRVCEAMTYAHSKGVIHRDLKPANIMVGRFGEVFVMDWGLARVLGRADAKDIRLQVDPQATCELRSERAALRAADGGSPLVTMDGDVVGTPAYMPPEQAVGDVDGLGPAADVYAVGAMLYHLLAGHAPYVHDRAPLPPLILLARVTDGPPRRLRDGPPELIAICERAMARDPQSRYAGMAELAADLRAHVEGRVVRAHSTGAVAELRKWVARNRLISALAALVVAALPIVGVLSTYYFTTQDEVAAAAQRAEAERVQAIILRGDLLLEERRYADAATSFEQALARDAANPIAFLGLVVARQRARETDAALATFVQHPEIVVAHPVLALLRAECLRKLGDAEAAADAERAVPAPRDHVGLYLAGLTRLRLARRKDLSSFERAHDALMQAITTAPHAQAQVHYRALEAAAAAGRLESARHLIRGILQLWPKEPSSAYRIATTLEICRDFDQTFLRDEPWLNAELEPALAAIQRAGARPDAAWQDLTMYAALLRIEGDLERLVRVRSRLVEHEPRDATVHYNLATALKDGGDLSGAVVSYREALRLRPSYLKAHNNLATVLGDLGDYAGALVAFDELAQVAPTSPIPPFNQAHMLHALGRFDDALTAFRRAAELNGQMESRIQLPTEQHIGEMEQLIRLEGLEQRGPFHWDREASPERWMTYIDYCTGRGHNVLACQLFAEMREHATDLTTAALWDGAYAAARAVADTAAELTDAERSHWRDLSFEWLGDWLDALEEDFRAERISSRAARRRVFRARSRPALARLLDPEAAALLDAERDQVRALNHTMDELLQRLPTR